MKKQLLDNASDTSLDRVDGAVKVTGTATYSAEYVVPGLVHAVLVTSTIAKGSITAIESHEAEAVPGVIAVISHVNAIAVPGWPERKQPAERVPVGTAFRVFYDPLIYFDGQPVAMVVAGTREQAVHAASLVRVTYQKETHQTHFEKISAKQAFL